MQSSICVNWSYHSARRRRKFLDIHYLSYKIFDSKGFLTGYISKYVFYVQIFQNMSKYVFYVFYVFHVFYVHGGVPAITLITVRL